MAALLPLLALSVGCSRHKGGVVFELLDPARTGVRFTNTVASNDSVNVQNNVYLYNGAGVAAGDIDNDGLPDLFFAGNTVSSRLYLNKGNMRFEDITESAGVTTHTWATGVSMVDINNDGYLDIYVSVSGSETSHGKDRANLLFINNGNRTFTEAAARYGIADTGFTTQAVFFDYNGDGLLDLFLLNNSPKDFGRGAADTHPMGLRSESPESWNKLYRNNGDGTFTDVSQQAGILRQVGYGLGVAVADVNRDGWPDLYVSNDVTPNDVLYINNGNGTFTDKAGAWLKHASYSGMGVDIADFNDDGWPDILQADMAPAELSGRKMMSGYFSYGSQLELLRRGFRVDYDVNSLQLSNGVTKNGDVIFSNIALMAGVAYTNWSWSALFADFDNDGRKDVFITNGYPKATNDLDYQMTSFAARQRRDGRQEALELLKQLHDYPSTNYLFRNNGDLTFSDVTRRWGIEGSRGYAYGAAYADLNNDGRLDIVVNNLNAPPSIYENVGSAHAAGSSDTPHYLTVKLEGVAPNRGGIGATLKLTAGGHTQYLYHSPYRGYMSTMDDREHFGLGSSTQVDSLEVTWPDGRSQVLSALPVDRLIVVRQQDAPAARRRPPPERDRGAVFEPLARSLMPRYAQPKAQLVDFETQPLLPYQVSRQGPPLAVGDVNDDGLEDVYIGGGDGVPGSLFLQRRGGGFVEANDGQPWLADRAFTDWGATFFDANGDGRLDLYVASGGYRDSPASPRLQDRLYINRGGGRFVRDSAALPQMLTSTGVIAVGDFNGDGKPDLFVGGRVTPMNYPFPTRSYILRNDGGHFTDVTAEVCPELIGPGGMITAAVWIDWDGDGRQDLVTAGEWMPLQFYHNEGGRLRNVTAETGTGATRGWWFSLIAADFNHDGRPDLVAGNLGENAAFTTSPESRFGVYAGHLGASQVTDVVLTQEISGIEYPYFGRATLGPSLYTIALRVPGYATFAHLSMEQLFGREVLQHALHYQTDTFASVYVENEGGGKFAVKPLPKLAQIAPIRGLIAHDVDGDGNLDLIAAGNLFATEANTPPVDAGNGVWLRGDGHGTFIAVPPATSGFLTPGEVTGLTLIKTPAGSAVLVANSGDSLQAFTIRNR